MIRLEFRPYWRLERKAENKRFEATAKILLNFGFNNCFVELKRRRLIITYKKFMISGIEIRVMNSSLKEITSL